MFHKIASENRGHERPLYLTLYFPVQVGWAYLRLWLVNVVTVVVRCRVISNCPIMNVASSSVDVSCRRLSSVFADSRPLCVKSDVLPSGVIYSEKAVRRKEWGDKSQHYVL